jgi:NAD(P)-dependent dehydrogenase (short-subunit alcohol dehydrogenase family)
MGADVALITGGSGGIGRAIADALIATGIAVAVTGRSVERLATVRGGFAVAADLRDPGAADRIVESVEDELGPVTILVNNAGTAPTARFDRTTDEMLDEVLDLHVRAPLRMIRRVLPGMRERGHGCVVQLASSAGLRGFAYTAAYTAAKHAMVGMTRALATELDDSGVHAYAVCPGFVDTEITRRAAAQIAGRGAQTVDEAMVAIGRLNRIGRMHTPAEVGGAVAQLCRDLPRGCVYDLDADPPRFVAD